MNAQEQGKCSFCGEVKIVWRKYLHAKNTKHIDESKSTPFTITFYCNDCGLEELEEVNAANEAQRAG